MSDRSNVDQIAAEVYQLLQAVPDDCENPQALVLDLAQQAQDRQLGKAPLDAATRSANAAAVEQCIQSAFRTLDPKAQAIMLVQLSEGSHYRAIAEELNLPPADVLRILTEAYAQLRWHMEPAEATKR